MSLNLLGVIAVKHPRALIIDIRLFLKDSLG